MPLKDVLFSEVDLIAALAREFGPPPPEVVIGIGDDCAAIALGGGQCLLWTVDTLVEGVHFDLAFTSLEQLGWKSLAVNVSDVAAMGGEPKQALLSLGWPPARDKALALEFARGMAQAGRDFGVAVIGGDTVAAPSGLTITVTLIGVVAAAALVRRAGADLGDLIYVTGCLGDSAAGLEILRRGLTPDPALSSRLIAAHLAPRPQVQAGRLLAEEGLATAMIDLSDGVASDLNHICRASGVAARIPAPQVPVSPLVTAMAPLLRRDPVELALTGGEDYQLLFTTPRERTGSLEAAFLRAKLPPPLLLGEIVAGHGVWLVRDQGESEITGQGFDHFRLDRSREQI